jgi:hypothetical protein
MTLKAHSLALTLVAALTLRSGAQQAGEPMGSVATRDARVTGGLEVQGDIARLMTNVSLTASDHDAPIALHRGGHVLVCSTSEFHLLRSGGAGALIFGLDRGAVEIATDSRLQDAVLTPDLKFVPVTRGTLDLKVRVTREGDTCVDNAGAGSPVLNVTDPFSSASYRILPGQHLLFVRGDLRKVVDHEKSSCGCPPAVAPSALAGKAGQSTPAEQAAAAHPFPAAQSAGLAPEATPANEAPAGTASSQVTTTFSYGENQGRPPGVADTPVTGATGTTSTKGAAAQQGGFFHAIGSFFHRLFHPKGQ